MYICIYVYVYAPTSYKVRRTRTRQTLDAQHFPLCRRKSYKSENSYLYIYIYAYDVHIHIYVYIYICMHQLAIGSEVLAEDRH